MKLYTSLVIFSVKNPLDCSVCLTGGKYLPTVNMNEIDIGTTSLDLIKIQFQNITGIDKDWKLIRFEQVMVDEWVEQTTRIVDIIYMVILDGYQNLVKGYNWIKISKLNELDDRTKNVIKNSVSRRF